MGWESLSFSHFAFLSITFTFLLPVSFISLVPNLSSVDELNGRCDKVGGPGPCEAERITFGGDGEAGGCQFHNGEQPRGHQARAELRQ